MERGISVRPMEMTRLVKVDHHQSWSRIFWSDQTRNGPFHLMYQPKFPEFWVEWKAPLYFAERRSAGISRPLHHFSTLHSVVV